jgi:hypothetical protein
MLTALLNLCDEYGRIVRPVPIDGLVACSHAVAVCEECLISETFHLCLTLFCVFVACTEVATGDGTAI